MLVDRNLPETVFLSFKESCFQNCGCYPIRYPNQEPALSAGSWEVPHNEFITIETTPPDANASAFIMHPLATLRRSVTPEPT